MSFGRSPYAAVAAVAGHMSRIVSCITPVPLITKTSTPTVYVVSFPRGQEFVRLRATPPLLLDVRHALVPEQIEPRGSWQAITTGYHYEVQNERAGYGDGNGGTDVKDVVTFDWHPDGRSSMTTPHVHVHSEGTRLSRKHHIPTGPVPLAFVVRFLIAELGVEPARDDWQNVLTMDEQVGI